MPWQFLSNDDRIAVTAALAELEMVRGGQTTRTVLLYQAGLAEYLAGLASLANSAARTFAAELLQTLEDAAPPDPDPHPLGTLLGYVREHLSDTPETTRRLAAEIVERYGLMEGDASTSRLYWQEARRYVDTAAPVAPRYAPPPPPGPGELPDPGPLPPGSRLPYGRNPLFTGRAGELLDLAAHLLPPPSSFIPPPSSFILSGLGGVGKTQLAVEFAHRYGRFFHGVHWISMADPAAVATEVALCGALMGLRGDYDQLPPNIQLRETQAAWSAPEPRLLIFDNCEDPALLAEWRPSSGGARVLVTSRNTVWPPGLGVERLPVRPLPREQSVALLREYTAPARRETDEALDSLAAEVGDLPLALSVAGHYLARYPRESIATYRAQLQSKSTADLLPIGRGAYSPTDHDLSVGRTLAVSYNKLDVEDEVDNLAAHLLACATHFAPGEPLPEAYLVAPVVDFDVDAEEPALPTLPLDYSALSAEDLRLLHDAVLRLLELGLLERVDDETVRLHRLTAVFVAGAAAGELAAAGEKIQETVALLIAAANEQNDPRPLRAFEVHMRHVVDSALRADDLDAVLLANQFGLYLEMSGHPHAARPYFERALAIHEAMSRTAPPAAEQQAALATSLNNMGYLLQTLGDFPEARGYYERALAIYDAMPQRNELDLAMFLNNLGLLVQQMGDLPAARPHLERALAIWERELGPDDPYTALTTNNLGYLLFSMGDLTAARPYLERALDVNERVLGANHAYTARSLSNMGTLLQANGDLVAARSHLERALAIYEEILGPEHPNTAQTLNNLGTLLITAGDLAGGRPSLERALAIRERALGPDHPHTAESLNNMGWLLQAQGDPAAARPYFDLALGIHRDVYGDDHPKVAESLNNIGYLLLTEGDKAAARPYFEQAHAIFAAKLGPDHAYTAASRANLEATGE